MDQRSPTFEANLLLKTAPNASVDPLVEDIQELLAAHETMLINIERVEPVFTLLRCDEIDILLAFTDISMPVAHFENVQRPRLSKLSEADVFGRLVRHKSSVTVLVMDRDRGAGALPEANPDRNRRLCRKITEMVNARLDAELVFWAETDMLFAGEEFDPGAKGPCPEPELTKVDASEPVADMASGTKDFSVIDATACWDIVESSVPVAKECGQAKRPGGATNAIDMALALALPNRAVMRLDDFAAGMTLHRVTNGISMLCASATIGISGLSGLVS